jgi:hypothetical protein
MRGTILRPLLDTLGPLPGQLGDESRETYASQSTSGIQKAAPLGYQMLPQLRASNGPVYIHPSDRKYGVLAAGGQGSGKTALLLRMYLSDIRDPHAAPIVVDPKSELAQLCLEYTPVDCGKRVWYLDLGHPMFGMSPLRLDPARTLPEQASAVADNIVQAISDTAEGQVFQSSRRYLYHAVIGALALATANGGLAMFEDIFALLLPGRDDMREAAVNACQGYADLDHTTEFFSTVLPGELENNRANTYQRLDPPRNKIETILASPALRRFYNHPSDIRLADIVRAKDILIVDANMAALGEGNAQVVMHLFFQQLHALMQEQVHLPPSKRPRVPTIWDEGGYVASMNTIKQAATHREAGLEIAMGIQYISQLGAKAESTTVTEAIRKGVTNLMQSRCLFRLGDPEDAEQQTRIAMSVYQTMIRSDLESRELLGSTPEQLLYLPVHYCLASWISKGERVSRFTGETFPFQKVRGRAWAEHHMQLLEETVGPYPEQLPKTYKRPDDLADTHPPTPNKATARQPTPGDTPERQPPATPQPQESTATGQPAMHSPAEAPGSAGENVKPLIREAGELPEIERSPVRKVLGLARSFTDPPQLFTDQEAPESIRELAAFVDPLLGVEKSERQEPPEAPPRLYDEDYAILALLDRIGAALPGMIRRAVTPDVTDRAIRNRLNRRLYHHGLLARSQIHLRNTPRGGLPYIYSLTRYGMQLAQEHEPPVIPPSREYREMEFEKADRMRHDLHLLSWIIELHEQLGRLATNKWRTPRWPGGTLAVPHTGNGRSRRQVTLKDIPRPKHLGIFDVNSGDIQRIEPDAICEIKIPSHQLTFDLCIEMDLTERVAYNIEKFRAYDAFLATWWSQHRRYKELRTRPAVLFVCRTPETALAYAKAADETLNASIGITGSAPHERYYPARDHLFFITETDIHNGDTAALALPQLPPTVRRALENENTLTISRVDLFDPAMLRAATLPITAHD